MTLSVYGTSEFDSAVFKAQITDTPHNIKIFNLGLSSFEERLQMIERAEKTIDVEYFIYKSDISGKMFTQALIKKAKEGVKVRLLLDYFMIKNEITPFHAHELTKFGIEVKYFNPTAVLNLVKGQYRNHRKVLIIDGKEALTGGRNIGDEYFDLSPKFNFLDRDIEVQGPIVESIQDTYDAVWNSKASKIIPRPNIPLDSQFNTDLDSELDRFEVALSAWKKSEKTAQDFLALEFADGRLVEGIRAKGKEELLSEYQGTCNSMTFNSEYPLTNKHNRVERIIKLDLYERIRNAKESILFDSPYFIDDKESTAALEVALKKNIKVKLLTNGLYSTDAIYVFDVFDTIISKWVKRGIDPYAYKGELPENYPVLNSGIAQARFGIHAKSFVFDGKDVVIGTFNFDPRSSNYNTEMVVSCENNPELANIVEADIESRMKHSMHLDTQDAINKFRFFHVGFLKKLEYLFLKIPSNIFDYLL
jgi:putative cardiolipin synthase